MFYNKEKKEANRGKGGLAATLWVDHWIGSCSWAVY